MDTSNFGEALEIRQARHAALRAHRAFCAKSLRAVRLPPPRVRGGDVLVAAD